VHAREDPSTNLNRSSSPALTKSSGGRGSGPEAVWELNRELRPSSTSHEVASPSGPGRWLAEQMADEARRNSDLGTNDAGHVSLVGETQGCRQTSQVGLHVVESIEHRGHSNLLPETSRGDACVLSKHAAHIERRIARDVRHPLKARAGRICCDHLAGKVHDPPMRSGCRWPAGRQATGANSSTSALTRAISGSSQSTCPTPERREAISRRCARLIQAGATIGRVGS